jgi:mersacidin/lichenicidin family type 2 lantibiotic
MSPRRFAAKERSMKKIDLARAWTDEDYYLSLTEAERESLPANPAAMMTVSHEELQYVNGGASGVVSVCLHTAICSACPHVVCE